jgi:hypothetical protein
MEYRQQNKVSRQYEQLIRNRILPFQTGIVHKQPLLFEILTVLCCLEHLLWLRQIKNVANTNFFMITDLLLLM